MKKGTSRFEVGKKSAILTFCLLILSVVIVLILRIQIKIVVSDLELEYDKEYCEDMKAYLFGKDITKYIILRQSLDIS